MSVIKISWAAARVNQRLTQEEVCKRLNISKPTLISWERGDSEPAFSKAQKLAGLYDISLDCISGGDKPPKERKRRKTG